MKLTANERYLLEIIARLRGLSYDLWGRLNSARRGRETIRQVAPKADLKQFEEELRGLLHQDHNGAMGAHLPHPSDPRLSATLKHRLIERHRRATRRGRKLKSVYDLVRERET